MIVQKVLLTLTVWFDDNYARSISRMPSTVLWTVE
jgi:hypothetical protein